MTFRVDIITEGDIVDLVQGRLDAETAEAVAQSVIDDPEALENLVAALIVGNELNNIVNN
tara:strand:+ start:471 stop:650 length:180 start_codon:yes stop_codon:yes gene_type:complete